MEAVLEFFHFLIPGEDRIGIIGGEFAWIDEIPFPDRAAGVRTTHGCINSFFGTVPAGKVTKELRF